MLVLHSSSRCDVCLSEYSWDTSSKSPHAIPCGHIFCRDCLYTNNPPLCPLCRKLYQPNKMKKLHVDKPDDIDDHKEVDLLQRLVISWETPPEQLLEIITEVDSWLGNRADDSCIPLRKARAALDRHRTLKNAEVELLGAVRSLEEETQRLNGAVYNEQDKLKIASDSYLAQINDLTREITHLRIELNRLRPAPYGKYTNTRNPLPPPPEPISTDQIPTFEQAVTESGASVRFTELPGSPRTRYPTFEVESRSNRRGKTRSSDRRHTHDDSRYYPQPTPQGSYKSLSSNHYVQPHVAPIYEQPAQSSSQLSRSAGLQLHFEQTNQPLDAFALTHAYLREYSTGFLNGQEAAMNRRVTTEPSYQPHPSSNRHPPQPQSAFEPTDHYGAPSANIYHNQPYSAPLVGESSSRPPRRRQNTLESSIISSSASSHIGRSRERRSSSRSRSRSRTRGTANAAQDRQATNSLLSSVLPNPTSSNPARSPATRHSSGPIVTFNASPNDMASPDSSNAQPNLAARTSPSVRSRRTLESGSWGTPAPSHLASGSLISGLRTFAEGVGAVFEGGAQEITTFHPLDSDGASIRTRQTSISDLSAFNDVASQASPVRPVQSMVGVLPGEDEPPVGSGSRPTRVREERITGHRSTTSLDARSHHSSSDWDPANGYRSQNSTSSGYVPDDDRSSHRNINATANAPPANGNGWPSREDRASSYRSPTTVDPRAYNGTWADLRPNGQDHTTTTSHTGSRQYDDDRDRRNADAEQPAASSNSRSRRSGRPPLRASRALAVDSPAFPVTVEYTDDDHFPRQQGSSPRSNPIAHTVEAPSFNGNALGLELTISGISAPTPIFSTNSFLRSWSHDPYES